MINLSKHHQRALSVFRQNIIQMCSMFYSGVCVCVCVCGGGGGGGECVFCWGGGQLNIHILCTRLLPIFILLTCSKFQL